MLFAVLRYLLRKQRLSVGQFFTIYVATLAGVALLYLGLTGRLHPLMAFLGVALPFISRALPWVFRAVGLAQLYRQFKQTRGSPSVSGGKQVSSVRSDYLDLTLNHETGVMEGAVLKGQFAGVSLSALGLPELLQLLQEVADDPDSVNLLTAYLNREYPDWQRQGASESPATENLSETEALEILGLDQSASEKDIIAAHRKMIQKLHPDKGGSTYLARQINAAKDLLLRLRGKRQDGSTP